MGKACSKAAIQSRCLLTLRCVSGLPRRNDDPERRPIGRVCAPFRPHAAPFPCPYRPVSPCRSAGALSARGSHQPGALDALRRSAAWLPESRRARPMRADPPRGTNASGTSADAPPDRCAIASSAATDSRGGRAYWHAV
eukprot:scaffold62650_cov34-Phaeocystis_antarctica.AAC.1